MEELHSQEMQKRKEMQLRSLSIYLATSSGISLHCFYLVICDTVILLVILESNVPNSVLISSSIHLMVFNAKQARRRASAT